MKCYFAEDEQKRHYPEHYLVNGVQAANPERPERLDLLKAGAMSAGLEMLKPEIKEDAALLVHSTRYLNFLKGAHERWSRIPGASPAVTPNIHPSARSGAYPASVVAQAGWHMIDASCPIETATYESACWSASAAFAAADAVLGSDQAAYALCRPPGHHAGQETAGGFCYFNNTAIAAERLRSEFSRVAVLDVDLHHGNGTQEIFYSRGDVLTVSIHADPKRFYPFFWGHADEVGEGDGLGANVNLPIPRGSGDAAFLAALDLALGKISSFAPDAVVIALGLDAYEGDPIAGLAITTGGFDRIGARIGAAFEHPTVIVQEGGYPCPELSDNLTAFFNGYCNNRRS